MSISNIKQQYNEGMEVFKRLFTMPCAELKTVLKDICQGKVPNDFDFDTACVRKTSRDDEPENITVSYYDSIHIGPFGIRWKAEHGQAREIVAFNKYFVLP